GKIIMEAVRAHVLTPAPDLATTAPSCKPELARLVNKLLAKQTTQRPVSALTLSGGETGAPIPVPSAALSFSAVGAAVPLSPPSPPSALTPSLVETRTPPAAPAPQAPPSSPRGTPGALPRPRTTERPAAAPPTATPARSAPR